MFDGKLNNTIKISTVQKIYLTNERVRALINLVFTQKQQRLHAFEEAKKETTDVVLKYLLDHLKELVVTSSNVELEMALWLGLMSKIPVGSLNRLLISEFYGQPSHVMVGAQKHVNHDALTALALAIGSKINHISQQLHIRG